MFENQERTNIESFGEFGLIDHLTKRIELKQKSGNPIERMLEISARLRL